MAHYIVDHLRDIIREEVGGMKKTKTIQINEPEMAESKTIKIEPNYNISQYPLMDDITDVKGEVSKLVSSVKLLERQEKIDKRRRWRNAARCRRRYH